MHYLKSFPVLAILLSSLPVTRAENPVAVTPATVDQRVDALVGRMTLDQKIDLIGGVDDFFIRGYPALGWPRLKMADGPMGVRNWGPATAYPAGIGLAATWNPEMARAIGEGLGRDARAKGVHFLLGPGVNLYRAPMNGRNFEYFGEDPCLGARIAVAYIEGVQSQGVIATVKHYLGNNSEFDRHRINDQIDERTQREIYLPIFEAAVTEAGVGAIMDSYNLVNGEHLTQNAAFNIDVARRSWGFRGIIMSDWDATYDAVAAANGGLDLEMPSGKFMNRASLLPAIEAGKVTVETIDEKVRRIVRAGIEFGFLDREQQVMATPRYSEENRAVAERGAVESAVLLKNDGPVLPLDRAAVRTFAVIGPGAHPAVPVGGGSAAVEPFTAVSYLQGFSDYLEGIRVLYSPGLVSTADILDQTVFTLDAKGAQPGIHGEYFGSADFSGTPVVRDDARVNFEWRNESLHGVVVKGLSIRWTGFFTPARTATYHWAIGMAGGDSTRLYLDGRLVSERKAQEGRGPEGVAVPMEAGKPYAVKFECVVGGTWRDHRIGLGAIPIDELVSPEATKIAAMADAVVVFVGFNPGSESEGGDRTFGLGFGQDDLVKAVAAANKRTVVVLTAGGAVDVTPWLDQVPAVLQAWYGGQEAGRALPRILFGESNPSGHLPISWERRWEDNPVHDSYYPNAPANTVIYQEGVFVGYRGYEHRGVKPLFPFGHGLSYTTFAFSDLTLSPAAPKVGEPVTVSFDVANTGPRAGAAVAQLYLGNPTAGVPRPPKELKGFERIDLQPGEKRRVTLLLGPRAMSYWDVTGHDWKQEPGKFAVSVGHSSADIDLTAEYTVAP